jgi:predicted ATP-grasp superfamily ATP-dependent carboligase
MSNYRKLLEMDLKAPILLAHFEGFVDAGFAGRLAISFLSSRVSPRKCASIDCEPFVAWRLRRPPLSLREGTHMGPRFPEYEVGAATHAGKDLLILTGPEPDLGWKQLGETIAQLALDYRVSLFVGLGGFPAPAPHTRPVRVASTSPNPEMVAKVGFIRGSIEVPSGFEAFLEAVLDAVGVPAVGLWARVPHYVASMEYPLAAASLLEEVRKLTGLEVDTSELYSKGLEANDKLDRFVASNEQFRKMVGLLEMGIDSAEGNPLNISSMPSEEELNKELENFLRDLQAGAD